MAAAFDAESAKTGNARDTDQLAALGFAQRRQKWLECVHDADDVGIEHRAEDGIVLAVISQRAPRDAGVGNDDIGSTEASDEIGSRIAQRIRITDITGIYHACRRPKRCCQRLQRRRTASE